MADDDILKKQLERLKHAYGLEYEMIRVTGAFEHAALRPLFILNGGALVVYLGLYGALHKENAINFSVGQFAAYAWVAGVVFATLTAFFGAWSQFAFRKLRGGETVLAEIELGLSNEPVSETTIQCGRYSAQGDGRRKAAVAMGCLSVLLFVLGFLPAFLSIKQGP